MHLHLLPPFKESNLDVKNIASQIINVKVNGLVKSDRMLGGRSVVTEMDYPPDLLRPYLTV